ncbi:50S ribosomal protein L15 [Rhizomicrobium electricum]|jgi:large subunit ribosomal protein L15|uniref:Large ribosomal subunit protein uL15 n=1 Tax=Rhizomicrobium electricum TaxID=480070 RepID=A0ABN1E1Y3_9PROT|nr:50S ribosomal protein L15 [Rhizomicrobium electricum]NIJ47451.1 large subunit ribosomal protein L15 [Rhizomicrobium electricum]
MKLNEIANKAGARHKKTKVGRGSSSGLGKTCGRGVKGAKARTGNAVYGFEGGQMPLHMRMPKRGFRNIFGTDFAEVNLGRLQKAVDEKKLDVSGKIDVAALKAAGLVSKSRDGVRLLAKGEITAKLTLEVAGASKSAVEAVERAGGSVVVTYKKKVTTNKKGQPGKRQQRRIKAAEKRAAQNG